MDNGEVVINGLHMVFAFAGFALGIIIGAVYGWQAHKECGR